MSAHDPALVRAASPELELSHFGSADHPFITLPSLRRSRSAQGQGVASSSLAIGERGGAAAADTSPPSPSAAADFFMAMQCLSPALASVLSRRADQVAKGYDAESDDKLPIGFLLNEAMKYATDARDWLARKGQDPDRRHFRHKLTSMIALGLAELERLDRKAARHD